MAFSISTSQKRTVTPTQKLLGHGQTLNSFSHMPSEWSGGPDKACSHFFISDISVFRSLLGKGYQQILLLHRTMTVYLSF